MDGNYGGYSSYQNNGMDKKDFKKIADAISSNIQKISSTVLSMKKMVNLLGTSQDSPELRQKLYQIQHYTNTLVKDTSASLKELSSIPMPQSHSQQRDCKMQRDRLAEEFTTTLNAFQDIQRQAYQKEKEEQRNRASSGIPPPPSSRRTDPFNEQLIELQDSNTRQQIQEHLEDERNLQIMEDQERTIQQLERDISDVNKIFKDLGALVHDQGEVIDSIEANVEKTEVSVSEGRNQLRTAEQYSTRLRKKKCVIVFIVTVILVCLLLIIFWKQ